MSKSSSVDQISTWTTLKGPSIDKNPYSAESNQTGTYFELFRGKAVNHSTNTLGSGRLDLTKLTKDELHDVVVDCRNEKNQIMGKVFFQSFFEKFQIFQVKLSLTISGADTSAAKEAAYLRKGSDLKSGHI